MQLFFKCSPFKEIKFIKFQTFVIAENSGFSIHDQCIIQRHLIKRDTNGKPFFFFDILDEKHVNVIYLPCISVCLP